ncbi:MAG: alpha/beta hydrolase [Candidatus Berkiellales bacterium]
MQNPSNFPNNEGHFLIDGPAGHLELLTLSAENDPRGVGVICHPHPLHLGTMNNKVVYTLSRAFHNQGLHTVRFNFRGVGKSEGEFGHSEGETADLLAVLAWVDAVLPNSKIWLAGFSFGAYIAAMGAAQHACEQLYSIAPSVINQPFDQIPMLSCPWVIIQGDQDEVIPPPAVNDWFATRKLLQPGMSLLKIPGASHFFHGKLVELRGLVEESFRPV